MLPLQNEKELGITEETLDLIRKGNLSLELKECTNQKTFSEKKYRTEQAGTSPTASRKQIQNRRPS